MSLQKEIRTNFHTTTHFGQENVITLDIPVNSVLCMNVHQTLQYLLN